MATAYKRIGYKLELLLRTAQMLRESGCSTKHIMGDLRRAASFMEIPAEDVNLHLTYSTITINISNGEESHTRLRECGRQGTDMTIISSLSKLNWRAIQQHYTLEKYEQELERIGNIGRQYSKVAASLGAGCACGGFCVLFGGDWVSFFFTALCAGLGHALLTYCNKMEINHYIATALAACAATLLAYVTLLLPYSATPLYPIISSALFLVPGIPLINGLDDLFNTKLTSGTTRIIYVLLVVACMTFGIVLAMRICYVPVFTSVTIKPDAIAFSHAIAAATAAMGFSTLFNIPPRLLAIAGLGGCISVLIRNLLMFSLHFSTVAAAFSSATLVSILSYIVAKKCKAPPHVLIFPMVIPMIPGVLLYRFLFGLINIETLQPMALLSALRSGVEGTLIVLAIAIGATIPELLAHRYLRKSKQRQLEELLAEAEAIEKE